MAGNFTINGVDFDSNYIPRQYIYTSSDKTLWAWSMNGNGQLGQNNITYYSSPVQVGTLTSWSLIGAGKYFTTAIKTDGTLWTWGLNTDGQLGLNNTTSYSSPVQVGTLTNWSKVSASGQHVLAVKTDGSLWAWGNNLNGALGNGSFGGGSNQSSPVQIGTLTNWSKVSAGGYFSVAIKTDGTLWSWGLNTSGQLGLGNTTSYSSPVQVGTLTTWSEVFASQSAHVLAVKTDGTLWSWGFNQYGKLGLNNTTSYSSPVQVGTLTTWSSLAAGQFQTVAIKTDGTMWSWGYNNVGRLGLGNTTSYSSPVQIGTLTTWSSVSSTGQHTLALRNYI